MRALALGAVLVGGALAIDRLRLRAARRRRRLGLEELERRLQTNLARPGARATALRGRALTPRIVELSGLVADAAAAREAVTRARAVPGVEVVIDRLETTR